MEDLKELAGDLFEEKDLSITTDVLNGLVRTMIDAEKDKDAKKEVYSLAEKKYQAARDTLISALERSGNKKYYADGMGVASLVTKLTVRTPKDIEAKEKFFEYIKNKYGKEALLTYSTVNHQTLNSFYNEEFEKAKMDGTADSFHIDGIEAPVPEVSLSFRKAK